MAADRHLEALNYSEASPEDWMLGVLVLPVAGHLVEHVEVHQY